MNKLNYAFDAQAKLCRVRHACILVVTASLTIQAGCKEAEKTGSGASEPAASTSTQSGFVGGIDPCILLTQSEAATILEGKVSETARGDGFGQFAQCQYLVSGERLLDVRTVTVAIYPSDLGSIKKSYTDAGVKVEALSGIGDAAYWVPDHSMLLVQKDKRTAGFAVWREGVDKLSASRQAAAIGLARLPY